MKPAREVQSYTALSTSLVDPCFHKYVLTNSHVEMIDKGFTPKGTYPQRNRCKSHGHCSYLGFKTERSSSHPTPTEGPGMKSEFLLYRDYVDTRYYSKAVHIVNELAHATYWNGTAFNKPLSILLGKKSNRMIGNNRIAIWTRDFDVDLHIDEGDEVSPTIFKKVLSYFLFHCFLRNLH